MIGYEDCDYISTERKWSWWNRFEKWYLPIELHIPCRDPVDHLMSQCNMQKLQFDCSQPLEHEVSKCELGWNLNRYGDGRASKFDVKCYRFEQQFTGYLQYMSHRLQKRRKQVNYTFRATNKPRSPAEECIFSPEHADLKGRLEDYLLQRYEYYRFCRRCIGSKDDLLL